MAIIDPEGLFHGERLKDCSDLAQLFWPRFLLAANGLGRIHLDYDALLRGPLASLKTPPSKRDVLELFREYREHYLAFPYVSEGELWAQWDVATRLLSKYQTAADRRSPAPPEAEYQAWKAEYTELKKSRSIDLLDYEVVFSTAIPKESTTSENSPTTSEVSENSPTTCVGIGIGIGVGEGKGKGKNQKQGVRKNSEPFALPDWVPVEAWNGFEEMRRKKHPLTDRARRLIVSELDKIRSRGHPPGEVLDQSTRNDWRDVYELKEIRSNGNGAKQVSNADARFQRIVQNTLAGTAGLGLDCLPSGDAGDSHADGCYLESGTEAIRDTGRGSGHPKLPAE